MQLTLFDEIYDTQVSAADMIEKVLQLGSGVVNGEKRIYEYVLSNPTKQQLVAFLKDEYGIGGRSGWTTEPYSIRSEHHDAKGIKFSWIDGEHKEIHEFINWNQAADVIIEMVAKGRYSTKL